MNFLIPYLSYVPLLITLFLIGIIILMAVWICRLKKENQELQMVWMKECERRAIAEEKGRRLPEIEELIKLQNLEIQNYLIEQGELKSLIAQKEARLLEQGEKEKEKLELLEQAQQTLTQAFKAISTEALNHNIHSFLELATSRFDHLHTNAKHDLALRHQAIDHLVLPIQSSLQMIGQQTADLEKIRLSAYSTLTEQIHSLSKSQVQLHTETANLVKALRMPHVRGRWGEIQLKRVIEMAGMIEHCDFVQQESVQVDDKRLRPDVVIKLPNGKQAIIDAKAPLQAYLDALETENEVEKIFKLNPLFKHVFITSIFLIRINYIQ